MAGKGGARPGAGRPKRLQEDEILAKFRPYEDLFFQVLEKKIRDGSDTGLNIFAKYYLGEPLKQTKTTIEGNLSGLSVEIINRLDEHKDTSK